MKTSSLNLPSRCEATALLIIGLMALNTAVFAVKALAAETPARAPLREMKSLFPVIDLAVKDSHGQKLGSVMDLALDLEGARVVEVIVASGGFLGFGQRIVAIPPGAFLSDASSGELRLNVDKEKYMAAPDFKLSKWAEHSQSRYVAEVYRYYGQEPYFAADGNDSASGHTATEPLGYIERSSELLDLPVKNLQNELLGYVSEFLFDPLGSRCGIKHVIVQVPGFLRTKRVVPAAALRFNAAHDALHIDRSVQAFMNEPRFKWTYASGASLQWATGVDRRFYNTRKGFFRMDTFVNKKVKANEGVNTRQNVQEGLIATYTPLVQGASFTDVDTTHSIYAAMRADAGLSQNAQNVEVATFNGRITLRGHVNTAEGKRAIGEIASTVGHPENVSNLLEVRPLAAAN